VRCAIETGSLLTRTKHIDAKWSAPGTEDFPDEWTMEHDGRRQVGLDRLVHSVIRQLDTSTHGLRAGNKKGPPSGFGGPSLGC
jgi:hypothetical protein